MAYPTGHGASRWAADDWDTLAPDYDQETLPRNSETGRNRVSPDQVGYPADDDGYLGYPRGSGEFDNREFAGVGVQGMGRDGYRGHDPRVDAPQGRMRADEAYVNYAMGEHDSHPQYEGGQDRGHRYRPHSPLENGLRHRTPGVDNRAFTHDEVDQHYQQHQHQHQHGPRRRFHQRSHSDRRGGRGHDGPDGDDSDRDSVETLVAGISPQEMQRTMDFLATIRIKRRSRKSIKRQLSQRDAPPGGQGQGGEEQDEEEEEVGLPSQRAHPKPKTLAEKLQEAREQATAEAANVVRSSVLEMESARGIGEKVWPKKFVLLRDALSNFEVWAQHFKEIEGRFGSATAAYFRFTRWLVFLNFFTFLVSFLVIVVPFLASSHPDSFGEGVSLTSQNGTAPGNKSFLEQALLCSENYQQSLDNITDLEEFDEQILSFVTGTGWMQDTIMFYGAYHNRTFSPTSDSSYNYNMGLAYILAVGAIFLISFLLILLSSSQSVKDAVQTDEGQSNVYYTNSVLCAWDFCITSEKTSRSKKRILIQEFLADLLEQKKRFERQNRTRKEEVKLFCIRLGINILVLMLLAGSLFLIYYTTNVLLEQRDKVTDPSLVFFLQFLPSLTITALNFIVPLIFEVLVTVEDYRPAFELKITLIRWVLLRLSSLVVLVISLYYTLQFETRDTKVIDCPQEGTTGVTSCCSNLKWDQRADNETTSTLSDVKCWETYVGQQFYKLALVDFAVLIVKTFCVEFPRRAVYDRYKERFTLVNKFGQQFFDLPEAVLDIVYSQTLSWLGMFFAPLIAVMTFLKVIFIFYLKKLTLMRNYSPPQFAYKASSANSFFMTILLVSFILSAAGIGYLIGNIEPSKSCGPFRVYSEENYVMWTALTNVISTWPKTIYRIVTFFGTAAFFVPAFILLCLLMYCYWAAAQGYKKRESLVQAQLKMEGKDKQFLLARVNDIISNYGPISAQGNLE